MSTRGSFEGGELQTLVGFVDPESWSSDGHLTRVAIASGPGDGRERCVIVSQGRGRGLLSLVNARVRVSGRIFRAHGELRMTVADFETVDRSTPDSGLEDHDYEAWAGIPRNSFHGYRPRRASERGRG